MAKGTWTIHVTKEWIKQNRQYYDELIKAAGLKSSDTIINVGTSKNGNVKIETNDGFVLGIKPHLLSPEMLHMAADEGKGDNVKMVAYLAGLRSYLKESILPHYMDPEHIRVAVNSAKKGGFTVSIGRNLNITVDKKQTKTKESGMPYSPESIKDVCNSINSRIVSYLKAENEHCRIVTIQNFIGTLQSDIRKECKRMLAADDGCLSVSLKKRKSGSIFTIETWNGSYVFVPSQPNITADEYTVTEEKPGNSMESVFTVVLKEDRHAFIKKAAETMHAGLKTSEGMKRVLKAGNQNFSSTCGILNQWVVPCLTGPYPFFSDVGTEVYDLRNGTVIWKNHLLCAISREGKKPEITYSDLYNKLIRLIGNRYVTRCREEAMQALSDYDIRLKDGEDNGILFGSTALVCRREGVEFDYRYEGPSCLESVPNWRKALQKNIKKLGKQFEAAKAEKILAYKKQYAFILDNLLATDIYEFVKANEKYITANAVSQALRGVSVQLSTFIVDTDGCGKYNAIPSNIILRTIEDLVYREVFREVTLKGTFGKFSILKVKEIINFDIAKEEYSLKNVSKKQKQGIRLTDQEAVFLIEQIAGKEELDTNDYMDILSLIDYQNAYCRKMDLIHKVMSAAPAEIKTFIKFKKNMTEDAVSIKLINMMLRQDTR